MCATALSHRTDRSFNGTQPPHRSILQRHSATAQIDPSTALSHRTDRSFNGTQPPHRSILHHRNVVFPRSLHEMFAARHDMVEIACGCAAHTGFALPVAAQMFRCPGWRPVPSALGWPSATAVCDRASLFWVDVNSNSKSSIGINL